MSRIFKTACLTIIVLLTFLAVTCDEDCPVCPEERLPTEKEYHFLYSFIGDFFHSAVLTYSTKTGEVVDSTYYGRFPFWDARFTSDGRYACYTSSDADWKTTWITEYATGDTVSVLQGITGIFLALSHDNQYLLLSAGTGGILFSVPTLEIIWQQPETSEWLDVGTHPFKNVGVATIFGEDSLLFINFETDTVSVHKVGTRLLNGEELQGKGVKYSRDGSKLVLWGVSPVGIVVQARDAETLEILQEYGSPARTGPYVHPDGERVYFLDPWRDMGAYPSSVWELNLRTLLFRKILDGLDYQGTQPHIRVFSPCDMDITPDGKYAFFINGGEGLDHGPIFKFDLDTYQFVDAFFPPGGVARVIRMYPLEIIQLIH